jgi:hypothetical protein
VLSLFSFYLSLFDSVDDVVDHYKKEQIVEGYNLKDAVSVQVRLSSVTSIVVRPLIISL